MLLFGCSLSFSSNCVSCSSLCVCMRMCVFKSQPIPAHSGIKITHLGNFNCSPAGVPTSGHSHSSPSHTLWPDFIVLIISLHIFTQKLNSSPFSSELRFYPIYCQSFTTRFLLLSLYAHSVIQVQT